MILGAVVGACIHILTLSIWLFRGVYKHWCLDVQESTFILNLCFLCTITALVEKGIVNISQNWVTYMSVFTTFIVTYHVHLRLLTIAQFQHLTEYIKNKVHHKFRD